jgi:glycosyltransferase involved in cell wall biosynthesis
LFALPDRWAAWWFGAVTAGMRLIRRHKPDALWSTYPIATAHLIGLTLAKWSGLPWVADLRDSMTEDDYPVDPRTHQVYRWIERQTVHRAQHVTFTAPSTIRMYGDRYPHVDANRWKLIYNGYDEADFDNLKPAKKIPSTQKLLVHAGILYPSERDPRAFFQALACLKNKGLVSPDTLKVRLRATAYDDYYIPLLHQHGIEDIVELAPSLPYADALQEMNQADGLLLFQASNCNHQIPAKLYEYMRAGQPILALTDRAGDTAKILLDNALDSIAALDNTEEIAQTLATFLEQLNQGNAPAASQASWEKFSRRSQTQELAELLHHLTVNS